MRIASRLVVSALSAVLTTTAFAAREASASPNDLFSYGSDTGAPQPTSYEGYYLEPGCTDLSDVLYDKYLGEDGYAAAGGAFGYHGPGSVTQGFNVEENITDTYTMYEDGHGMGAGTYFFLNGPTSDGATTETEAIDYGWNQGAYATADYNEALAASGYEYTDAFLWGDVEGGPGQPVVNGWSTSVTLNQDVVAGFISYLQDSGTNVGIYSAPSEWQNVLGSVELDQVSWTYEYDDGNDGNPAGSQNPCPTQMFVGGPGNVGAQFFGGQGPNSDNALGWQWVQSPYADGDWDQFDLTHYNSLFGINLSP